MRAFARNRGAVAGLVILLLVAALAALAPMFFPYSPWEMRGGPFLAAGPWMVFSWELTASGAIPRPGSHMGRRFRC